MRLLILILIFFIGCTSNGIYDVRQLPIIGVAVSTESLISVIHPIYVGQKLRVLIRGKWVPVKITKLGLKA